MDWRENQALVADWAARKPEAIKRVNAILKSAGLTMDSVMAQSLSIRLDDIERIDRMIALAEARRNAALRELDAHQENQSQKLRLFSNLKTVFEQYSIYIPRKMDEQRTQDKVRYFKRALKYGPEIGRGQAAVGEKRASTWAESTHSFTSNILGGG